MNSPMPIGWSDHSPPDLPDHGVSIIMPTYNQQHLIGKSIQSVLNQEYRDFELIIIDDGSPDNTAAAVAHFHDERLRYIRQENTGLPGARNSGLRVARGRYVALLDGDDLISPRYLSTLVTLLRDNPGFDVVYCRARFIDEDGKLLPQLSGSPVPESDLYGQLLKANFLTPNCVLAHRYCYEAVGFFDTTIPRGEGDMWLQFAAKFSVISTPEILAYYRVLTNSMSSIDPLPMLASAQAILQKHCGLETTDPAGWAAPHRQAYARSHITAGIEYLQKRDADAAYSQLRQALAIAPELLAAYDVFYELGCGDQPRGYRGDYATLDVAWNADVLFRLLARLFSDPDRPEAVDGFRRVAYLNARLALAQLSYATGNRRRAGRYGWQAIAADPRAALQRHAPTLLLKNALGPRGVNLLKKVVRRGERPLTGEARR